MQRGNAVAPFYPTGAEVYENQHQFRQHNPTHHSAKPLHDRARSSSVLSSEVEDIEHDAPLIRHAERDKNNFQEYAVHTLRLEDADVQEHVIEYPPDRPLPVWKSPVEIPRWVLLISANGFIIFLLITLCIVFVNINSQVGYGQSCLSNSDCSSRLDLKCTAGTCACSTLEFWDGYRCTPQRTFNRSCQSQSQCNSLTKLLCMNVTNGLYTDSLCWCSSFRYWTGGRCATLKTYNVTCSSNGECDTNNFLTCMNGICDCNSTQFWNYQYCENKRTYGNLCFTNYWCDNSAQGLTCSTRLPTTGTCDCSSNQYWWSTNSTCTNQLPFNASCSYTYQCRTNMSLYCSPYTTPNSCQCTAGSWYNSSACVSSLSINASCTNALQCNSALLLSCNLTAQRCTCSESAYIWDGAECVSRRSIGGACQLNSQCLTSQNLICATSGVWNGTCACPVNYYWNSTSSLCVIKKLWNQTCATSYECYDGGYLSCQPSAALNTTICDCGDYTYYWTGFLNNTYSGYCTPKINYNATFNCVSSYQCRDYNYVTCISNQCTCNYSRYWDGTICEPRLNYSYPCNSTTMCRNWPSGPNLQCILPSGGSVQQCLCSGTQYFDYCLDYCYASKNWQQTCNVSSCYATSMCDQTRSLSCINNICNCSLYQWWNSTICLPKGTYLSSCTTGQNYQCQEYNLLSCIGSLCQCGSNYYWSNSSNYCQQKKSINGTCASTNECLTASGVGLSCISGRCQCSSGYVWNSVTQQCDPSG